MRRVMTCVLGLALAGLAVVAQSEAAAPVSSPIQSASPAPVTVEGEDWSLPAGVKPKPYSGLFLMDGKSNNPLLRHFGETFIWQELNPKEGVYDFSRLEGLLAKAKAEDRMLIIRVKCSVAKRKYRGKEEGPFIPQWVLDKYNPPLFYTKDDAAGYLRYAPLWHEGIQAEYKKFVAEFGRRGIFENPHFLGMYLHCMSSSYGEEFSVGKEWLPGMKAAGLTSGALVSAVKARMDWWSAAAGPDAGKLAWVGAGEVGVPYNKEELDRYAWSKGIGNRGGFIEHYFGAKLDPPQRGLSYKDGYVSVDWSHPVRDGRYYGDENEENDEFPGVEGEVLDFCAKSPWFRAAQLGMDFLWVSNDTIRWAGEVPRWYTLVAGKKPGEAPDAACWLREAVVRMDLDGQLKAYPWKNFEHLLMQRDLEGAKTVATLKYKLPYTSMKMRDDPSEYSARRTDAADGQREMVFFLHPEFRDSMAGGGQVKVTWFDGAWAGSGVEWKAMASTAGGVSELGTVTGVSDGKWKTTTFTVGGPIRVGALRDRSDIVLRAERGDLTVRFVRVVKP